MNQTAVRVALDNDDLEALRATVRGVCAHEWPDATAAPTGDLGKLWQVAVDQGWTALGGVEYFPAALAIQEELGGLACPLPIVDTWFASTVMAMADETIWRISDGSIRLAVAVTDGRLGAEPREARHVEAARELTDVLVVDTAHGLLTLGEVADGGVTELPGLPIPSWSHVRFTDGGAWQTSLAPHSDAWLLWRVGLATRATAAVARAHELARVHAIERVQFGRPVGSFQAVSHRLVGVQTTLTAARQLRDHALDLWAGGADSWRLAAEIYLDHVVRRLPQAQFDSHHTLAAIGYFEEHEAPWLFRRVHADLAVLASVAPADGVGDRVLAGEPLPAYDLGAEAEQLRSDVIDAFAPWADAAPSHLGDWDDAARAVLRDRGWLGVGWPEELGGGGFDAPRMQAFSEAIAYVNPPVGNIWMGIDSIVPMLTKVGPPELRDLVMAEARRGDLSIALGYSEPESGSDLASLRTRADRVAGGWIVNGQKLWGTCVPDSKWIMLAARTDPDASPPHAGISLFLVDLDSPGITVQQHRSLGGEISATTFWDDVFVPEDRLVGEVNGGWAALGAALAGERLLIGASVMKVLRTLERLVAVITADPERVLPSRRQGLADEIGGMVVDLQVARGLITAAVREMANGGPGAGAAEASMAKVIATELAEDLHATAISLFGPDALYGAGVTGVPGDGHLEDGLRASIMGVIAGGTGDIQRNLIARQMGLPR